MTYVLEVRNLVKRYGNVIALDHVNLEVEKGELVVVLGPSGSGKSSLLLSIAGFIKLDEGRIFLDGKDVTNVPPYRRNVGMVFQSLALFPHMNVYDNIAFPLKIRKFPKEKIDEKVKWILDVVRMSGLEKRRIDQLSGGQRQRVAIARTLVFEPSILLLDEPLGALDRKLREEMQVEIKKIHERVGATTLLVTHDQQEAMTMADRIVIMKDGKIEQVGKPIEIYKRPKTLFTAEFMGVTNIFEGEAELRNDVILFKSKEGFIAQLSEKVSGKGYVAIKAEDLKILKDPKESEGLPVNQVRVVRGFFEGNFILYELDFNGRIIKAMDQTTERIFKPNEIAYVTCNPEDVIWLTE